MTKTEQEIKDYILSKGADVCGIGGIERFEDFPDGFAPKDVLENCKSVITFGMAIPKGLYEASSRLIYGHFNYASCPWVDKIGFEAAKEIERKYNAIAVPIPCDGPYDSWNEKTLHGHGIVSMKHAAVACGVGAMGKNTILLNPIYGNRLTIGVILTNLELKSDELCENICLEGCHKCIDNCPVGAIKNGSVDQFLCRPNTYGTNERGFDIVKCNKCRSGCPMRLGKKS